MYGARPLKRVMQSRVLNPLSRMVLEGQLLEGDHVEGVLKGDHLELKKKHHHAPGDKKAQV